jgi:hypothetical protein
VLLACLAFALGCGPAAHLGRAPEPETVGAGRTLVVIAGAELPNFSGKRTSRAAPA